MARVIKVHAASRRCFPNLWTHTRRLHTVASEDTIDKNRFQSTLFTRKLSTYQSLIVPRNRFSTVSINNKTICEITSSNCDDILSKYDTILMDCDGVLWLTDDKSPIAGIPQTIAKLRHLGKHVMFVTNNSLPGRDEFAEKFRQYGFDASIEDIFTVCYTATFYLKHVAKIKGSVFAIGTSGMEFELKQMGLKYYGFGPSIEEPTRDNEKLLSMKFYDDVDAVLVGFDEYFGYVKLYKAASYLTNESCLFVATTNLGGGEKFSPTRRQPITAAIVDSVTVAAKREPILMNKPHAHMYNCIKAKYPSVDKSRTLFIGDSVNADIGFAKTIGIDSALVLTGTSSLASIENYPGLEPDFLLKSLAVLGPPI